MKLLEYQLNDVIIGLKNRRKYSLSSSALTIGSEVTSSDVVMIGATLTLDLSLELAYL